MNLFNKDLLLNDIFGFFSFSFLSSFIYIINDLTDRERDTLHPRKKNRPVASGVVSPIQAITAAFILLATGFMLSYYLDTRFKFVLVGYLVLNISYNFRLKHIGVVDCFCIAIGFVLRVLGGCYIIDVEPSDWILTVTFFLALYLAFSKRKAEMVLLETGSGSHRVSLQDYTLKLLDTYMLISATISLTAYLLYTFSDAVVSNIHNDYLKYSAVFVVFGFFRFFQIIETKALNGEGDPTVIVLKDLRLQLCVVAWVLYICLVIYG